MSNNSIVFLLRKFPALYAQSQRARQSRFLTEKYNFKFELVYFSVFGVTMKYNLAYLKLDSKVALFKSTLQAVLNNF